MIPPRDRGEGSALMEESLPRSFLARLFPKAEAPHTQKITIVFKQFFQTRSRDVRKLEFCLLRCPRRLTTFEDVLFA